MTAYREFDIAVDGGVLHGGTWHPDATGSPVITMHGITASHLAWPLVAERLPDHPILAPDLRGRARSNGLPGPYALSRQADDVVRVLDAAEVERAAFVGHSMGAFVAALAASRHPDRASSLVLVDGGLPIRTPPGIDPEKYTAAVLGPALERLSREFANEDAYLAFWRAHPALGPWWNDEIAAYARYDLDGAAPHLRSSTRVEAVAENTRELDGSGGYAESLAALRLPTDFLRAERGLQDGDPLYSPADVAREAASIPGIRIHEVTGVNHYTILMTEAGAGSVAAVVEQNLGRAGGVLQHEHQYRPEKERA